MNDESNGKFLTAEEWQALVESNPVLQFIKRVEDAAVASPLWNANYALALYRAFGEEARRYTREECGVRGHEVASSADA
ncbi:MAG TPA: hypothetical protein VN256_13115 [Pyrinomonadaceae bacterium]|nr:hypothetical protein [Pyrinomonadaceae bacterium]